MKHFATLLLLALAIPLAAEDAPNFIIIYSDDLGYADTLCKYASFKSWREGPPKADAERAVRDRWDVTE